METSELPQPHDNWGAYYDFVYEQTFGSFYHQLTHQTLAVIQTILPKGSILDFGAGTGRLSIPLREKGYQVIAVEQSSGMVQSFSEKLKPAQLDIAIHHCSIADYANGKADLAIALFTVLAYATTAEALAANLQNICRHIKPGGYFFFDLPESVFFHTGCLMDIQTDTFSRRVDVMPTEQPAIYTYQEQCSGALDGQQFSYEDTFTIRHWKASTLDTLLRAEGLVNTARTFPEFTATGSIYHLYQRQ